MSDEEKKNPPVQSLPRQRKPGEPILAYKSCRPKRRRAGYLNDGQWAPGYGPDAKKKPKP